MTNPLEKKGGMRGRGHDSRRRLQRAALALGVCLLLFAAACSEDQLRRPIASCSRTRLNQAGDLLEDAKSQAASHYQSRADQPLILAFYGSRDAIVMARSIKRCFDFDLVFRREAVDIIHSSILLQRIVRLNMREPDPSVAQTLLRDRYYKVFKNDIDRIDIELN